MSLFSLNGVNEAYDSDEYSYESWNTNVSKEDSLEFSGENEATKGKYDEGSNTQIKESTEKGNHIDTTRHIQNA
jgi:hypothetical protein